MINRLLLLSLLVSAGLLRAQPGSTHGPARGSLVLEGGIGLNRDITTAFITLAGGPASHIVVIPTASVGDAGPPGMAAHLAGRMKQDFGVAEVTVVHTSARSRNCWIAAALLVESPPAR